MRIAITLRLVGIAALAAVTNAQTPVGTMSGNILEHFGAAVISAGFQDADTYADLLVGVPNDGVGSVRCISGRFLATGVGPSVLWTVSAPGFGTTGFGSSIASVGNLTGNSATDFVVGDPGYKINPLGGPNNGALFLVDGSTHVIAATIHGFDNTRLGEVVVSVGDQNGDGKAEIAATAPDVITSNASWVYVIQGSAFSGTKSLSAAAHAALNSNSANEFGDTLASNFDLDGNGKKDLAIGSPRMFGGNGWMYVVSADNQFTTLAAYSGTNLEHMGASISATHDYNGDGVVDFVVGAPNWSTNHATQDGRAVVLSGANLRSYTFPYELATYALTAGGVTTYRFGAAVRASPDLNGDGIGDFMIGAPDYHTLFSNTPRGAVFVYSGATLTQLAYIVGANNDRLGDAILGGFQDVTGDFFPEFVVSGSGSDNPSMGCGVIKLWNLCPAAPAAYCASKINSLGCSPAVGWNGYASVSSAAPFLITCSNLINQTSGLYFYSHAPKATPFQGGTLCVQAPLRRSPVMSSGGSSSGSDCTGTIAWDFNARIQSGVDPTLVAGVQIFAQCWARDSASPSTTSLSNGLRILINP